MADPDPMFEKLGLEYQFAEGSKSVFKIPLKCAAIELIFRFSHEVSIRNRKFAGGLS